MGSFRIKCWPLTMGRLDRDPSRLHVPHHPIRPPVPKKGEDGVFADGHTTVRCTQPISFTSSHHRPRRGPPKKTPLAVSSSARILPHPHHPLSQGIVAVPRHWVDQFQVRDLECVPFADFGADRLFRSYTKQHYSYKDERYGHLA
ncbi:hypothetical protein BHE74_00054378 [Ensete ventricosum]|nr:hypothetical protein BHE74_00054378 [Ensete ventricosum]